MMRLFETLTVQQSVVLFQFLHPVFHLGIVAPGQVGAANGQPQRTDIITLLAHQLTSLLYIHPLGLGS